MADGMLHDILEIERRIGAMLADERRKAEDWLRQQKDDIDRDVEQEMAAAASTACHDSESRCREARDDAAATIKAMRRHLRGLSTLSDAVLRRVVRRHLSKISGGACDDYPDGQN